MLGRHLRPPSLLPIVSICITWRAVVPVAVKPFPSISYIYCSLLSPTPYVCFGDSSRILFGLNLYIVLYYGGLYSGRSISVLRMWTRCVPIMRSDNIVPGVVCGYRALYCI